MSSRNHDNQFPWFTANLNKWTVFSKQSLSCHRQYSTPLSDWPLPVSVQIQYWILRAGQVDLSFLGILDVSTAYFIWFSQLSQNVFHSSIVISSNFLMMFPLPLSEANVMRDVMQILSSLCSFRNTEDPLCSSTITPKFKTVIDENIYYTQVNYDLININIHSPAGWEIEGHIISDVYLLQGCVDAVFRLASEQYIYFIIVAASLLLIGGYPSLESL